MDTKDENKANNNELVNNGLGVSEAKEGEELIKHYTIPETPFGCLKHGDDYYLTLGKYKLTKALKEESEVLEEATNASWDRVLQVITIAIENSAIVEKLDTKISTLETQLKSLTIK